MAIRADLIEAGRRYRDEAGCERIVTMVTSSDVFYLIPGVLTLVPLRTSMGDFAQWAQESVAP